MDPEENQQSEQNFIKKAEGKLKDANRKANKAKKAIKIFIKLPMPAKIAIIAIIAIPIIIVMFAGFLGVIDNWDWNTTKKAKKEALGAGSGYSASVVTLNKSSGTWDVSVNEELKNKLTEAGIDTSGMSQDELLKQLLMLYGISDQDFSDEELDLMPTLLKAEIATQYVDLRKRDEMYDSSSKEYKTLTDSEIKTAKENNQILGTIHLKRVNTSDLDNSIILEYIDYEKFKEKLEKNNYDDIKGYFSINDEENLVIATWNYNKITYTLADAYISNPYINDDSYKNSESYNLFEMVIDYKPLVNKYTLPFEVLTALLINSEDAEFVEKVANLAFSANIEITIAEEMTQTNKTYVTNYYETIRNYQYIQMCALVNGRRTEIEKVYTFLDGDSDTKDNIEISSGFGDIYKQPSDINNCTYKDTNYALGAAPSYIITQTIETKDNTYKYGITYADTWFMKATKNISSTKVEEELQETGSKVEGVYEYSGTKNGKRAELSSEIKSEYLEEYYNDHKSSIEEKAKELENNDSQGTTEKHPIVIQNGNTIEITYDTKFSVINSFVGGNLNYSNGLYKISINNFKNSILKIKDEGGNIFTYEKGVNGWNFVGSEKTVEVDYNQATIRYKKTDTQTSIEQGSKKIKYELVEETPTQTLYDKKDEKFLKAYDESSKAKGNMSSTPGWLEELLDEYDPNYSTIITYLLDSYYGRDTGEYNLEGIKGIYSLGEFTSTIGMKGSLVVKLDEQQALKELSKDEIKNVIENYFTVKNTRNNFLEVIDSLVKVQEQYKVNAVFIMAIIQKESSGGTGWNLIDESTYNWASIKGSYNGKSYTDRNGTNWRKYNSFSEATEDLGKLIGESGPYFSENRYTIEEIGEKYCQPPEEWINKISTYVIDMYESIGETVYIFTSEGNELQNKVVEVAKNSKSYSIIPKKGYCQGWVADVYAKAGANSGKRISADTAVLAGRKWGVSKDWNTIQLGATVYGYAYSYASKYNSAGHVGIYIGNGQVAHNIGCAEIVDLKYWIKRYDGICWGWNGGIDLTGGAFPSKGGLM